MISLEVAGLILGFFASAARADAGCGSPAPIQGRDLGAPAAQLADWVEQAGSSIARVPPCMEDPDLAVAPKEEQNRYFRRWNEVFALAERQIAACAKRYPEIREIPEALSILRQATLTCEDLPRGTNARNKVVRAAEPAGAPLHTTNFDRSWTFILPRPWFQNIETPQGQRGMAADLFHEALHSTRSNNRPLDIHSERSENVSFTQCKKDDGGGLPIYGDRVYFVSALCFPDAGYVTQAFWAPPGSTDRLDPTGGLGGPGRCVDLCKEAFTRVWPGVAEGFKSPEDVETLVAKPYDKERVDAICGRVKEQFEENAKALASEQGHPQPAR